MSEAPGEALAPSNGQQMPFKESAKRSPEIGKLVTALAKSQLSFKPIKKSVENTFYYNEKTKKKAMYADLAAVLTATQDALASNGLVVIQSPRIDREAQEAGIESILAHSSGEWLSNEVMLPATAKVKVYSESGSGFSWGVKFDAQTCGIAVTYARRYSYQSLIGVAAEEDTDANEIGEAGSGSTESAKAVGKAKEAELKAKMEKTEDLPSNVQGLIKSVGKMKTKDGKTEYRIVNMILTNDEGFSGLCFRNHKYPDGSTLFSLLDLIQDAILETKRPCAAMFAVTRGDKGVTIDRPIQLDRIHFDSEGVPEIQREPGA